MKKSQYKWFLILCAIFGMFFGLDQVKAEDQFCEYEFLIEGYSGTFKIIRDGSEAKFANDGFIESASGKDKKGFFIRDIQTSAYLSYFFNENGQFVCPNSLYLDYEKNLLGQLPSGYGPIGLSVYQNDVGNYKIAQRQIYRDDLGSQEKPPIPDNPIKPVKDGCSVFDGKTSEIIKDLILMIRIALPILVIVLGIIDFVSAIVSSDDKALDTAKTRFIKRLVAGALILFVPALLSFLIDLSGILDQYDITDIFCSL